MNNYYELVKSDSDIIKIYKKINEYENKEKQRAYHDYNHVINVSEMVRELLESLNYDKDFIDEAQVAAVLHDTGCTEGKENHEIRSYEFAKLYLEKNNIQLKNRDMVLEAIKNHRNGFDTDNIITLTLILADKLDIKKTRVTREGCNVIGNRQYQYINDINLKIDKNNLKVYFDCDEQINLKEYGAGYSCDEILNIFHEYSKKIKYIDFKNIFNIAKKFKKF